MRETINKCGGVRQAKRFLETEVKMAAHEIGHAMDAASAVALVSDPERWKSLGGFKQIKPLLSLARRDQIAVLKESESSGLQITTVLRRRTQAVRA